jgi:transposase-like protein
MTISDYVDRFPGLERLATACLRREEFRATFGTEAACRRWFFRARWPNGFKCPACSSSGRRVRTRNVMECRSCRRQTSLTAGTLLHATRKPLRTWFEAAYLIVQRGVNARTLQKQLGLTYKVAWAWGHKLRAALKPHVVPGDAGPREGLRLEASRTRVGSIGPPNPRHKEPCGCSKLLRRDWQMPSDLEEDRDARRRERDRQRGLPPELVPWDGPPARDFSATCDLLATFRGSLSEKHLKSYLDEQAFRENHGSRPLEDVFLGLAHALALTAPHSVRQIVARPSPEGFPLSIFKTAGWGRFARLSARPWPRGSRSAGGETRGSPGGVSSGP